jgi:hypothetical protein
MPTTSLNKTQVQTQVLRRLLKEYLECVTGFRVGNCEELRNAVRSVASSMGGELSRDALRIIEGGGYEP